MKVTARIELPKKLTAKFKELKMPLSGGYDEGYKEGYDKGFDDGRIDLPPLEGSLKYAFAYGTWDWFLDFFKGDIKTQNINDCEAIFYYYPREELPNIKLNFDTTNTVGLKDAFRYSSLKNVGSCFSGARPSSIYQMFGESRTLKTIDNNFFNSMVFDDKNKTAQCSNVFYSCSSLRELPDLKEFNNLQPTYSYTIYYGGFRECYVLNEIVDLPIHRATYTYNIFSSSFYYNKRLKNLTFFTEGGKPISVNWSNQTIDLASNVGYASSMGDTTILRYNSGITQDKYVGDAASYEALKDDPDWYGNLEFSRYNIDSAIRTIASLPDVSSGSSNVIKFKGTAGGGSSSDGRTINQLTAEEIAVATAKGWTVSFA